MQSVSNNVPLWTLHSAHSIIWYSNWISLEIWGSGEVKCLLKMLNMMCKCKMLIMQMNINNHICLCSCVMCRDINKNDSHNQKKSMWDKLMCHDKTSESSWRPWAAYDKFSSSDENLMEKYFEILHTKVTTNIKWENNLKMIFLLDFWLRTFFPLCSVLLLLDYFSQSRIFVHCQANDLNLGISLVI